MRALAVFSVRWRGTPGTQFLCPPLAGSCSPHIIIDWRSNCQRPERVFSHPIKSEFRNPKDQFGISPSESPPCGRGPGLVLGICDLVKSVLSIRTFVLRICFVLRASGFEFVPYALCAFSVLRPNWRQSLPLPPVERQEMPLTPFRIAPVVPLPEHRPPPLQKPTHRELA